MRQDAAATLAALAELPSLVGAAAAEYEASGAPQEGQYGIVAQLVESGMMRLCRTAFAGRQGPGGASLVTAAPVRGRGLLARPCGRAGGCGAQGAQGRKWLRSALCHPRP